MKKFKLDSNFNPNIIKTLSNEELNVLSAEIRELIIDKVSMYGGHLGSNLGVVELTLSIFQNFDLPKDKLILDVGHQCYTYKIVTGRPLDNFRQQGGISGFQKRSESIYDCYEAGHSSTSISAALGFAIARDLKNEDHHVVCLIGDGSISNGLAFEGLNDLGASKHKVIVIINDNNMSIGKPVGRLHEMLEDIKDNKYNSHFFENLGFRYINNVDGYDFDSLKKAFDEAKKETKSVIVHVSTIKGKGYIHAENDEDGYWHGVNKFDKLTGREINSPNKDEATWSKIYARGLESLMASNEKITVINPGTAVGSNLQRIMNRFSNRFFDVGIAEEHSLTLASGMALSNLHPYVSMYSSFLQRGYDQLNQDIARMDLPVTLLIDRSGLVGHDGETHQGIFDAAFMMNMPNISIAMAKDQKEALSLLKFSSNYNHPLAIRYPKGKTNYLRFDSLDKINELEYGCWIEELKAKDTNKCVITYGPVVTKLKEKLKGLNITLINAIFQAPLNEEYLKMSLKYSHIFVYDPYGIEQGFGYHIEHKLQELNYKGKLHIKAIKNEFITHGSIDEQLDRYDLGIDEILNYITNTK